MSFTPRGIILAVVVACLITWRTVEEAYLMNRGIHHPPVVRAAPKEISIRVFQLSHLPKLPSLDPHPGGHLALLRGRKKGPLRVSACVQFIIGRGNTSLRLASRNTRMQHSRHQGCWLSICEHRCTVRHVPTSTALRSRTLDY